MKIEIIYDHDCPNVEDARKRLQEALVRVKEKGEWTEWERSDKKAPQYVKQYGSPTILVNGYDIYQNLETSGDSCRIYLDDQGRAQRVPTVDQICSILLNSREKQQTPWHHVLHSVPAAIAGLLPPLVCLLCWPAYTAFLSSIGLGFINYSDYLLPLIVLFLIVALISFWVDIRRHSNYIPFVIAILSGSFILIGKFLLMSDFLLYSGVIGIVLASLYNVSPFARRGQNRR